MAIKIGSGSTPHGGREVYQNSGIKFIRSQNVYDDGLHLDDIAYITEEINNRMPNTVVQPNDILLNITGASIGRSAIVPPDFDMANVNQHVSIIRLADKRLQPYAHKVLISYFTQAAIRNVQVGAAQEGLPAEKQKDLLIPLPPLAEQVRIVSNIEMAFALIEEIEKAKGDLLSVVTTAKSKVLSLAISGKLVPQDSDDEPASVLLERIQTERAILVGKGKVKKSTATPTAITADNYHYGQVPKNWVLTPFKNVCEIYTGNSINEAEKKKKYLGQQIGLPYIGTKDVSNENEIDYENGVKIPDHSSFRIALPHSTLLCIEGGSAGRKIAITNKEVCFGNKLCCFVAKGINSHFIYYYLQTAEFKEVFKSSINGIIGGVSVNKLKELLLPLPPLAEQQRIVATIKAQFDVLNEIAEMLN